MVTWAFDLHCAVPIIRFQSFLVTDAAWTMLRRLWDKNPEWWKVQSVNSSLSLFKWEPIDTQSNNNKCKLWNCLFIFYNGWLSAGFPILHSTSELLCPVNTCCCHNMHAWVEKKKSSVKNSFYLACNWVIEAITTYVYAFYLNVCSSWLKNIQVNLQTAP